jgi:hypothetical protein
MDLFKAAIAINKTSDEHKKYLLHETKYALLGASLFVLFVLPFSSGLIANTFPMARGPLINVYKVLLFIALYYIIQKTKWFQEM